MAHLLKKWTTKARGDQAEDLALQYLQSKGLKLLARQVKTPGRGGGELDLIMQERDGTVVFVEVRMRRSASHGGAWASVDAHKQRRLIWAARHYLSAWPQWPPCRFDVVGVTPRAGAQAPPQLQWLQGAFWLAST